MKQKSTNSGLDTIILFGLAIIALSCNSGIRTDKFLDDDALRGELYSRILNDHAFLGEFMDSMTRNDHARMMVRADKAFVEIVMLDTDVKKMMERMIAKVENDSVKTKEVCSMMMDHKNTKKSMMEVMKDKSSSEAEKGADTEKHKDHH